QCGPLHSVVCGQGDCAPEIARADRRSLLRLAFREPDPLRLAEHLLRRLARSRFIQSDPFGVPIGWPEESHCPARRLAPGGWLALPIPHPDLPVAFLLRYQRLAGVAELDGLVGTDLAAIPQVALIGVKFVPVTGDQDLVARLDLVPGGTFIRAQHPAQARLYDVDAQRVFQVFATQLPDSDRRPGTEGRH